MGVVQNCCQLENETCRSFTHITLLSEYSCVLTDTYVYKTVCVYCEVPTAYMGVCVCVCVCVCARACECVYVYMNVYIFRVRQKNVYTL